MNKKCFTYKNKKTTENTFLHYGASCLEMGRDTIIQHHSQPLSYPNDHCFINNSEILVD